jgi:hypothetical protein
MKIEREVLLEAVAVMERAFRRMEAQVPPPKQRSDGQSFVFRYADQSIEQALIQKLVRYISGLHAIDVLLLNGLVQEQAVIQRTLDEIGEDIHFLVLSLTNDKVTPLHDQYLAAFWEEEFDAGTPVESTQKRNYPPRQKIRAYCSRVGGLADPSTANEVGRTISKTYSGYVHASSPQVMDMCGGNPPRFHLQGMQGTPRIGEHARDAWNYFYRGLLAVTAVAKAFGDAALVELLYDFIRTFERASGTEYFEGDFRDL